MGHTLWIEDRGRLASETHEDLGALHRLEEPLDALSDELGVQRLSSFYDYSALEASSDPDGERICRPSWFDSASGLAAVAALRSMLQRDFAVLGWVPEAGEDHLPEALLGELRWCEQVLQEAVANGREFKLLVVA